VAARCWRIAALRAGIAPVDLRVDIPTLEDAYMGLVGEAPGL
jgi:hypothetical protein